MAGYTRATGDWVKDSQAEKEKKKKEAEERKRKQEQAKREQQQRIAAQSKTVKKYERSTGDWTHDSAVVQSRLAPYSRANLSRQNARQQKTESYMDLTTANEPKARAGIEMYKAKADAQKYAEMNRVGYRNYDQDTVDRSVSGFEAAQRRWQQVYDANKGPAAIDPKTSRQSEIRSGEQKVQRYTDTGTGGSLGKDARADDKRWAGVTQELKRVGQEQRYLDTPGAKRTWSQEHHADESRERYRELYDRAFKSSEAEEKEPSVAERYSAANQKLRTAERDAYYWDQAAKDAAWFGDEQRFARALPHITESGRRAQGALAQFRAASDEMAGAVREQDEALKQGDLATWYARNLSDDEIRRRLEEEQRPLSVTDKDRAENPGMYPDAAFRTMPRQASFDPTMTAGGKAPGNRFYMTDEEKQLTEQSDRYLLQQKVNDREVQIAALERAQQAHHERDLEQEVYGYALSGRLSDMAKQGQDAMRQDMSNAQAHGNNPMDVLAQSGSAEEALALFRGASAVTTIWRNLTKCSDEQKERVYAMYSVDPQKAVELSQKYYDDAMDAYYAQFYNWANSKHGWQAGRRLAAGLLGAGAKLLSGFDPFGDAGQDLSRAGEAFIGGASESASRNGLFGIEVLGGDESPISGNVPYIGRGRAGEAVQLGTSILESSAIAVPAMLIGRYDVAASKVAGLLGTTLMGSSAAADDYRESIRNGLTDSQAIAHATAAGIAEAAFEYISLDRLIDPGNIKKGLIRWLTQGGIEASEEVCTTTANRISDEVIANFSGIRNSIEREALEYQLHGYSAEEAEAKAQNQWLSGLLMDGLSGFMSGLIMGGGSEAFQSATGKIANTMAEDIKDYRSGSLLGLESAGYTNTDTMSALSSYAEANGIDVRGLTDVQAKASAEPGTTSSAELRPAPSPQGEGFDGGLETKDGGLGSARPTETKKGESAQTRSTENGEANENGEKPRLSKRDLRRAGKVRSQIVDSITQKFEGQTAAEKAAQYDSLVEQYGSGIEAVATEALYNAARQDMRTVTDVTTLEQRHGTDAAAFTSETARQTMERAYRDTQQIIMRDTGDTTRSSMDSLAALNRNLRKTDGATLNLQAEVTGEDGGTKTVSVRRFDNEGKRVVLEDGSKVDVKDLKTDADTKSFLQAMQEAELGEYTNEAFQTFLNTGTEQTLADGIEWITGYRGAFGVGEVRGNITNAIQLAARYGLDTDTAAAAYYQGVKASDALVAQSKQMLANAQEMAKGQKQTVTGRRSNIDVSAIEGVNMTMEERRQFNFANKIFSMIGVELRWVASDEKNGRFVGANGSYLHGVVTLDIHAGRNFLRDVNSGILATTGHELTHFLQEYAPEQYRALKEFFFQQIVQGSANGEARLERLIWEKQRRASSKLSRRAAQDEVVADACQTMLRDSKAIREFAQQDEEAAKGIARWLDKWFGKLKQAFSRIAQLTEEARFVDSFAKEVRDAFGKLWDEALREAVETHDRVGNIEKTQQQNSDRDAEYLELAKDPEKNAAKLQEMVDERAREAGAMTLPGGKRKPYYHGTAAKFTSFDINKSGDGTFGYGFYFTPVKSFAQGYGPVKSYYIMTDRIATWEDHRINPEQVLQIRSEYGLKTGENDVAKVAKWLENAGDSNVMLSLESAITRNTNVRPAEFLQRFREIFGYDGLRQARETVLFDNRLIKSADPVTYDDAGNVIPLSERFNTENQDIRYSYRGVNAKTADLTMLEQAEEMLANGTDSETVRQQTGWFKGMDGKWRFEINDSNVRVDKYGDLNGRIAAYNAFQKAEEALAYEAGTSLEMKLQEKATFEEDVLTAKYKDAVREKHPRTAARIYKQLSSSLGTTFTQWADAWRTVEEFHQKYGYGTFKKIVSDYIDAAELFKAYPRLAEIPVQWEDFGDGSRGMYNGRSIMLDRSLRSDPDQMKSTLLHELQHAVQEIEGFARGSSPEYWRIKHDAQMTKLTKRVQSLSESLDAMYADIGYEDYYNDLERRAYVDEEITPEEMDRLLDEYVKEHSPNYGYPLLQQYKKALDAYHEAQKDGTPFEMYQRTAGEIESRDVQNRMGFTDEERRNNRPDIDRKDVVFTENANVTLDSQSESAAPMDGLLYSERTWSESRFVRDRENAAKALAKALNVSVRKAKQYIDDINSVAKAIADDRVRLDYLSSPGRSAFKSNAEYGGSIDFSTLCKKRQLLTGTFNAIQHALANTVLTAEDVLRIRQMMQDAGLEVNCGMCYVEGSRARMGEYNKTFLKLYQQYYPDNWQPKMEDVNTTDGLELMRMEHPECYEQYEHFYNNHGTLRSEDKAIFSSQAKPKEYQLRTEYKGEIKEKFQKDSTVEAKNLNGGLRMQSFSDFEIVHLIDCMQVIMDMSEVGLAGQAYTKVPEFAEAMGKTGLKINLSLVAKGVDENGRLIFNDVEGMPHERAFGIREKYSENVGTILVVYDDAQLVAAMADDKVDFIIPFHRSQWRKSQYAAMGLPKTTKDYTYQQNEKWMNPKAHTHEYRGKTVPTKCTNYMPNEYWNFDLSGKQNAELYLEKCAEDGKRPKFYKLLQNNGDGTYSLKADGSTDGYWKLLIDFKMYDNNGVGVPQQPVQPIFDMDNAMQMLDDYSGDPSRFPVAEGIVDEFVSQYKAEHPGMQMSERDYDAPSDVDLVMGMDEKDADTPEGKALIREVHAKQKQIETLLEKLAEAKRQLTTTKRALNTKGIGNVAGNVIRDFGISDAKGKNIKQQATGILTEAYQKALDQIDDGATAAEAWETVYNAAVEAAELLIDQGRYTENNNGKWTNVPYSQYIGEDRQMVIDQMVSEAAVDFTRNRYRAAIQETAADRLVARTEKRMQGKLDETKAKNAELKAENERLEQDNTFLKDQADGARFVAGNLYDQVKDLRQELKDNRKLTAQERKTVQKKIDGLNRQIEAKKAEAAAWRDRANRNASLLKSALESKSRDIQTVKVESQRQVDRAVAEKEAAVRKLEAQIEREQQILAGKLKPPAMQKMLKNARETAAAEMQERKNAQFQRMREGRKASELRNRIKNLSDEMKRRMTRPTDGAYVPASLYGSMTKLADVLDTVLAPNPGTKAETRYRSMMDAIHSLAAEYDGIKNLDDYTYASEFDQEIRDQISELERVLNKDRSWTDELTGDGKRVGDLSLTELQQTYDILRQINQTMKNAAKLMNNQKLGSLYDAMRNVADQQAGMRSRNASNAFTRGWRNWRLDTMSTMRAVEKMSGWDRNAALYQLMQGIEQGVVNSDIWMMNYNKRMEALKTGKNELEYRKALSKKLDYGVKDTKDGIPVMMTKLQALQILMTAEREAANDKLVHLQKGGAEIRDAVKIQEGKAAKATSYHIDVTPELIQKIRDSLTEWDKQYMQTVHDYFKTESREMNKILYSLKNRVLETEEAYVPYVVDSNYLETKLTEQQAMNMWVKTPGSTNALKTKASQPVIIDGMDTVMAKHVRESADYIGLALPIRDFSKVYNGMLSQGEGEIALPVKKTIADNWGEKGAKLLTDAVLDVQGSSRVGSYNTAIAAYLNKLQSGFVKSALLINPSVTIKQAASYIAAESVISHRALIAGNRPLFNGQDASRSPSLIAQIFAAPSGSTATRIYNEIDEHTSMHYVRRQGMSYTELANEANRQGWLKRNTGMMGAKMEQNAAGHFVRKAGQVLNPVQWIQRMDVATTAALWVACKEQAKMDGMTAGTDEFWQHTTEIYEQVLRETQPMYDNLHRTNMQKEKTGLMQFLFPFRTVPVQNHGQIAASFDAMLAAKGKGKEVQGEAVKHFIKTVLAQTESAVVFSVMTFLAAGLKRKTKNYRDEDDEISPESILKGILNDTGGVWLSNILPMTGSELWSWGSKAINSLKGVPNGYTFDTFSVGVVDMLNDLSDAADRMFKASGKLARGEISFKEFSQVGDSFLATFAKLAGIPATTIKTYAEGLWGDVQDIREGRIPAYNDEAVERKNSTNARRFTKAWNAKDEAKMDKVLDEMFGNKVRTSDAAEGARDALSAAAKEAYQAGKMDMEEYVAFLKRPECFTDKGITSRITDRLKEDFIAGKRSAEETVELLLKYKDYKKNPEQSAWSAVKEWAAKAEFEKENGEDADDDDFSFSQYDELNDAVAADENVTAEIQELKAHGYTDKQINDALQDSIKKAFKDGTYTEEEAIDALVRYGATYSQNGKTVAFDKDKAWQTVREWAAKAGHEDEEDYSYSKYDDIDAALDKNGDISKLVKELTDHGEKQENITKHIKSYLLDRYVAGQTTEKALKNQLSRYCGITKTDEVEKILKDAGCEKDCGYGFDELKNAYGRGDLSEANAKKMLRKYGGLTDSGAAHRIGYWDYCRKNPDTQIKAEAWDTYYEKQLPTVGGTLSSRGMKLSSFTEYREKRARLEITDLDGDGKNDKKAYYVSLIDSLNISSAEKDALYYYENYGAKDLRNMPWH